MNIKYINIFVDFYIEFDLTKSKKWNNVSFLTLFHIHICTYCIARTKNHIIILHRIVLFRHIPCYSIWKPTLQSKSAERWMIEFCMQTKFNWPFELAMERLIFYLEIRVTMEKNRSVLIIVVKVQQQNTSSNNALISIYFPIILMGKIHFVSFAINEKSLTIFIIYNWKTIENRMKLIYDFLFHEFPTISDCRARALAYATLIIYKYIDIYIYRWYMIYDIYIML